MTPLRIITLPTQCQGSSAHSFAVRARLAGADLLELRSDLHSPDSLDPLLLSRAIPLLVAERANRDLPPSWRSAATEIDRPLDSPRHRDATLLSLHASTPLSPDDAEALWTTFLAPHARLKHIEPLGELPKAARLLATQRRLAERFGSHRVTVLATGPCALPWRTVLAEGNAFDYLALDPATSSAPGQRLLADAVRSARVSSTSARLGILGCQISASRSPRIHPAPFDRIDVPSSTPLGSLLDALLPWYRGFAITSPFKQAAAQHLGMELNAINTLVRTKTGGWRGSNTDVAGALSVLERLHASSLTCLGGGGAAVAVSQAATELGMPLRILRRTALEGAHLGGLCLWTWPPGLASPRGPDLRGATVAVIAYGVPARVVAAEIARCGGRALQMGPRWFVAQARKQQALWSEAA